jgi:hypothetical protein
MENEQVIRELNDCLNAKINCLWCPSDKALKIAIATLREKVEYKWIPVSERLPEDGVTVLGYEKDVYFAKVRDGKLVLLGGEETVSHWMPMPEPPIATPNK